MATTDMTYYSEIDTVAFYVMGSEENYLDSNVTISSKELFKGEFPVPTGVCDASMGTTSYSYQCSTCHNSKGHGGGITASSGISESYGCPGHSGSIDLRYPIKNPLFRDSILKWLKIICFQCGRLIVTKEPKASKQRLLIEYVKLARGITHCPFDSCQAPHPSVSRDKYEQAVFYAESGIGATKSKVELFNHHIRDILARISDATVLKVGKPLNAHPKHFVLDIIRVSPNTIRPDLRKLDGNRSKNSDITALTKNIVEINDLLPMDIPPDQEISKDLREMYFNLDMTYFEMIKGSSTTNNQVRLVTTTNKTPNSIANGIPKKDGRIRRSLMGKRVRYMMRSVITGDNTLNVDEVGIPKEMAKTLQIPETVRAYNRDKLNIYYINKRDIYPGCAGIQMAGSNKFYRIEYLDPTYELKDGDIVYRDIIDGDYVGFNRQPSLLFSSISAMRVIILEKGFSLRMNVSSSKLGECDIQYIAS